MSSPPETSEHTVPERNTMEEFANQVVLITGAGRGLGRDLALAFSSLGATVAANDINPINLDETVELICQAGGKATSHVFDIAKRMPIEALVSQVTDQHRRIDILVNHAGVEPDESILDMDEWEFHRTLDVNLAGPFFTMQLVGQVMRRQEGGKIVNLVSADQGMDHRKGRAAYLASQSGLIGLTQAAAIELSVYSIQVNAVCISALLAGFIRVPAWEITAFRRWKEALPVQAVGERADVAQLVLFLCSSAARGLTGQVLSLTEGI